jgi:hypothetical protein
LIAGRKQSVWDWEIIGRVLVYLFFECIGYFVITMLIELQVIKKARRALVNAIQAYAGRNKKPAGAGLVGAGAAQHGQTAEGGGRNVDGVPLDSRHMLHRHSASGEPLFAARGGSGSRSQSVNSRAEGDREDSVKIANGRKASPRAVGQGVPLSAAQFEDLPGPAAAQQQQQQIEGKEEQEHAATAGVDLSSLQHQRASPPSQEYSSRTLAAVAAAASASGSQPVSPGQEDDDVAFERRRVESGEAAGDLIVLRHLRKEFGWDGRIRIPWFGGKSFELRVPFTKPSMVAVKDLSLSVPVGQCFGFLGQCL